MNKTFFLMKTILALLMFIGSVIFEDASDQRLVILIFIFSLWVLWGFIRATKDIGFMYLVDGFLIFMLEYYSKFVVNYFFHSLYILVLIEAGFYLQRRHLNKALLPLSILALVKFVYLLFYQINGQTISSGIFNSLIILLVVVLIHMFVRQKEEKDQNKILYKELLDVYQKEKRFIKISRQNAVLKERQRIARDVHDAVGHQLTSLIMQLQMLQIKSHQNKEISEKVEEALVMARNGLQETRKAVYALKQEEVKGIDAIRQLIQNFEHESGTKVQLFMKDQLEQSFLTPEESFVLYRVFQESMTNAVKHTRADEIIINLETNQDSEVQFQIKNQLNNKDVHFEQGFGLSNMVSRIKSLSGQIEFNTNQDFFIVRGRFPLKSGGRDNDQNRYS